ncbi:lactate utilization protein B/C [Desulforamulus profundi]|uniref:Lactate utilization protein B/C n=1 Tax=Desulforamulus profundi TaxID=1383067 RepID=A0A2C6MGJ1_9FIRM|nr:lactate utilization protein [Desulforamulus profundi]MCL4440093.1 lactate utilization protein [Bacillota bacterium]MCL5781372.1 lactate utilization protein [Bacillota bacterium]PHJ38815.1 lactate utilization protein B/C [Desulforamulus profundi]
MSAVQAKVPMKDSYSECKGDALYEKFKTAAEALSAEVHRVANLEEARHLVAKIIGELKVDKVVYASSQLVDEVDVKAIGSKLGIVMTDENLRQNAADAGLGISQLDYAIAEIGTLVGNATSIESRMVSILPPVHMVFVRTKNLLPTLLDAIAVYNKNLGELPKYLTFVSGPSRTADIERVLTIGVHGPGRLIIVFID